MRGDGQRAHAGMIQSHMTLVLVKQHLRRMCAHTGHRDLAPLQLERGAGALHSGQLAFLVGNIVLSGAVIQASCRDQINLIRLTARKILSAADGDNHVFFQIGFRLLTQSHTLLSLRKIQTI